MRAKLSAVLSLIAIGACDDGGGDADAAGEGRLAVHAWGEDFIEAGIPAEAFVDGWAVQFQRFYVVVRDVSAGEAGETPALVSAPAQVVDLVRPTEGQGQALMIATVPAGAYDDVAFVVAPAAEIAGGPAGEAAAALMETEGHSVYLEATATKGGRSVSLRWGFATATRYFGCRSTAVVEDGGEGLARLTFHADHLFYDDLTSEEPDVRFDLIADADADGDGEVTLEEAADVDLTALERYQVGSTGVSNNLRAFLEYQTRTLGHIDGEGHCETAAE